MINISFTHNGTDYHRITKAIARKAYNAGKTILLAPCKMNPNSIWFASARISSKIPECGDFDKEVNAYEYFTSCYNSQFGRYAAYYIAQ